MKQVTAKRKDGLTLQVQQFETLDECTQSAGSPERLVSFLNMYDMQKSVFPLAFDDLLTAIATEANFPRAYTKTQQTIGGKEVEITTYVDPHRTEGDYIEDFRKVTSARGNQPLDLASDSTGAVVTKWLQSVLNRKVYTCDLTKSTRTTKSKIDEVYMAGARNIIANGSEKAWVAKLEKANITFTDFQTENAPANLQALAKALYDWNISRTQSQFV